MALIKCPHCGTENDTRAAKAGPDRIVKCTTCDYIFVTSEKVARIIREESGEEPPPRTDSDAPRTDISSRVVVDAPATGDGGASPLVLTLTAIAGPDAGKVWTEQKPLVFIGRRNADVILSDTEVSRQHAVIELHGGRFLVRDLGSTNGTYLDDTKVSEAELRDQGKIRVGDTVLVAAIGAEAGG